MGSCEDLSLQRDALARRLRACSDLQLARRLQAIVSESFGSSPDLLLGNLNGHLREAEAVFEAMDQRNVASWNAMLSGFSQEQELDRAKELFDRMPERDIVSWTAMVSAYAQAGDHRCLAAPKEIFDAMPERTLVSCNAMLTALLKNRRMIEARDFFLQGMPETNTLGWTAMVSSLAGMGDVIQARCFFDRMPEITALAWNSMISAYIAVDRLDQAEEIFQGVPEHDSPSSTAMIAAYGDGGDVGKAREVMDRAPRDDLAVRTAMLVAYAQNGYINSAREIFDAHGVDRRDVAMWNAMITAHAEHGQIEEAKRLFDEIPESNVTTWNAMITGYATGSHWREATNIFHSMPERNLVSWNALIGAYNPFARHGRVLEALLLLPEMSSQGFSADRVSFLGILSACSHGGMPDRARELMLSIDLSYFVEPAAKQYGCIVDLFGRGGSLEECEELVKDLREGAKKSEAWMISLLGACRTQGNLELGAKIARKLAGEMDSSLYVLLSNALSNSPGFTRG
ncbi:pentatricopeptide repeat-containing protein At4g02750-like [Selaginella moellendorffii]|uniref:pentatricopeptide repeat-containing protein At4g02750-like n=1 Tax=Selaginella moellendorffii TaxID=88036 RepID=UPI000D1C827B|nr:pentatricopeptide repeat-containing protein At4g02750-like [Selaginella moellendorffii]|eukprot:XP_024539084.1 pentatricopeptide repeat-containing protein At4g02750-like [Selaginella moellendorffii]